MAKLKREAELKSFTRPGEMLTGYSHSTAGKLLFLFPTSAQTEKQPSQHFSSRSEQQLTVTETNKLEGG